MNEATVSSLRPVMDQSWTSRGPVVDQCKGVFVQLRGAQLRVSGAVGVGVLGKRKGVEIIDHCFFFC